MSTNARRPTCDIKTNHLTPNEATDTSSEVKILSDMPVTKSVVERKHDIPDKGSKANSEVFLDQLRMDLNGTIIVMLGGMWDVSAVTGRYLSTDFVVSDAKGNMIHCSAKATVSHNFLRLKEGSIYSVKNFAVKPNKEEYRILKNDAYMLEFDGSTTIRKASVKADGFVRYPFQLQDFDDVAGYVTNVGRTNHLKSGSKNLNFHLANYRYRLEVDVPDNTAQDVVMFNETTTDLVKCSADSLMDTMDESSEDHLSLPPALSNLIGTAHVMEIKSHTYYEYGTFESFTCWQILPSEELEDIVGSSNLDDYPDNQP
ncbi:hypothetical protein Tco_1416991 [Tanacetum coccineum]